MYTAAPRSGQSKRLKAAILQRSTTSKRKLASMLIDEARSPLLATRIVQYPSGKFALKSSASLQLQLKMLQTQQIIGWEPAFAKMEQFELNSI